MADFLSAWATFATSTPNSRESYGVGRFQSRGETFTLTTAHDAGDVIALFPIPSNANVNRVLFTSDGGATAGAVDIGLYTLDLADGSSAVVDADLFASAQAVTSAVTDSDVTNESGVIGVFQRVGTPLWSLAGYSSDPGIDFWVCYTVTTDVDATTQTVVMLEGVY